MTKEIDFYTTNTVNGWKIELFMDELAIPYKMHNIDIGKGDQFTPEYLKINPNNKIPAIVDPNVEGEPIVVWESGAILIYLAQKTGKYLPDPKTDPRGNAEVHQWLMWQMAGFGPMLGQFHHFNWYAPEKVPYGIERYTKEANRLFKVLDTQHALHPYICSTGLSIADFAAFGWARFFTWRWSEVVHIGENVRRWVELLSARPAFEKTIPKYQATITRTFNAQQTKVLFGVEKKD